MFRTGLIQRALKARGLYQNTPDELHLSIMLSTDGLQYFNGRSDSGWIVILSIGDVPSSVRFKKLMCFVCAMIPGEPKDLNSLLWPVYQELALLGEHGIWVWDANLKRQRLIKTVLHAISGDIPALSKVALMTGAVSYLGCKYCKMFGYHYNGTRYFPCITPSSFQEND